jgi:hypothetical protein
VTRRFDFSKPSKLQTSRQEKQRQEIEQRKAAKKKKRVVLPLLDWAHAHRRINGQPFALDNFAPLVALYQDDHPHIVVIKPAQRGISEWAVTRAIHALDVGAEYFQTGKDGLNVGYLFPTQEALGDFSKERIGQLAEETEHLTRLFEESGYNDIKFKQVGGSFLYLRGAWSARALKSWPADDVIFDEYDEMAESAIALGERRLNAPTSAKRRAKISTPTFPGRGIHAQYLLSDQRVWDVQCQACGNWNELDFFATVRGDGETWETWRFWDSQRIVRAVWTVVCPSCQAEMDHCGPGRWRAKCPEITTVRGYWVPWYGFRGIPIQELALKAIRPDPSEQEEFFRSDLGIPYEAAGARITDAMMQALDDDLDGGRLPQTIWTKTTMGVDVGKVYNYKITSAGPDGRRYVRAIGIAKSWDELSKLMTAYKVRSCVVDAGPEWNPCQRWAAQHAGRVYRAIYPDSTAALKGKLYKARNEDSADQRKLFLSKNRKEDEDCDLVHVNRTMAMDAVYNRVAEQGELWPREFLRSDVIEQMTAPIRVVSKNDQGEPVVRWEHTKPDHYFHAAVYCLIAEKLLPKPVAGGLAQGSAKGW